MKKVLSISVGSSTRDHTTTHTFLGQEVQLSRQGTNGDLAKAVELYKSLFPKSSGVTNSLVKPAREPLNQISTGVGNPFLSVLLFMASGKR